MPTIPRHTSIRHSHFKRTFQAKGRHRHSAHLERKDRFGYFGELARSFFKWRHDRSPCHAGIPMQNWEYKVFASHLDPAELVVLLNESGREDWELVALAAVTDLLPLELIDPDTVPDAPDIEEGQDMIPLEAFRYIFKRPLTTT